MAKFPLNDWLRSGERSTIRWSPHVAPARLSNHQRLLAQLGIRLDGAELADRPGKGRVLMLVQITDPQGGVWQDHGAIDFDKVKEGVRSEYLDYVWSAFVLPGDYRVAFGVVDTQTGEHAAREERLHAAALRNDPLPEAWHGLPTVEFLGPEDPPDSWYLPSVTAPLHLPVETRRPVQIDLLANLTPSERATGSPGAENGNLRVLLPALKTISQVDVHSGSRRVEMLDLLHQRVAFHQDDTQVLDWPAMKTALSDQTTGTIDIKSLEQRTENAAFFISEVKKRIAAGEGHAQALVILSSAVEFESGEDLKPIDATPSRDCHVFYIRFPAMLPRQEHRERPGMVRGGGRHMGGGGPGEWRRAGTEREEMQIDQLEATLKPLAPRLFNIETPEDFRKALAAILADISRL